VIEDEACEGPSRACKLRVKGLGHDPCALLPWQAADAGVIPLLEELMNMSEAPECVRGNAMRAFTWISAAAEVGTRGDSYNIGDLLYYSPRSLICPSYLPTLIGGLTQSACSFSSLSESVGVHIRGHSLSV
jgi:hypothetical protein